MDEQDGIKQLSTIVERLIDTNTKLVCAHNSLINLLIKEGFFDKTDLDKAFDEEYGHYLSQKTIAEQQHKQYINSLIAGYMLAYQPIKAES